MVIICDIILKKYLVQAHHFVVIYSFDIQSFSLLVMTGYFSLVVFSLLQHANSGDCTPLLLVGNKKRHLDFRSRIRRHCCTGWAIVLYCVKIEPRTLRRFGYHRSESDKESIERYLLHRLPILFVDITSNNLIRSCHQIWLVLTAIVLQILHNTIRLIVRKQII